MGGVCRCSHVAKRQRLGPRACPGRLCLLINHVSQWPPSMSPEHTHKLTCRHHGMCAAWQVVTPPCVHPCHLTGPVSRVCPGRPQVRSLLRPHVRWHAAGCTWRRVHAGLPAAANLRCNSRRWHGWAVHPVHRGRPNAPPDTVSQWVGAGVGAVLLLPPACGRRRSTR